MEGQVGGKNRREVGRSREVRREPEKGRVGDRSEDNRTDRTAEVLARTAVARGEEHLEAPARVLSRGRRLVGVAVVRQGHLALGQHRVEAEAARLVDWREAHRVGLLALRLVAVGPTLDLQADQRALWSEMRAPAR